MIIKGGAPSLRSCKRKVHIDFMQFRSGLRYSVMFLCVFAAGLNIVLNGNLHVILVISHVILLF